MQNPTLATFQQIVLGAIADRIPLLGDSVVNGMLKMMSGMFRNPDALRQGIVVAYHPQTHSAAVRVSGTNGSVWTCVFADELISYSYGYSETHPPKEGEYVLVAEISPESEAGMILGRIAYPLYFHPDAYQDPDGYHRRLYTQLKETEDTLIKCFATPFGDPNDDTTHVATHFRPTDVYPGEFAHVNQHNCGMKGGMFSATLLGGGASLRLSALANSARLSCDTYKRISMLGNVHEFHNGRYLSSERDIALYQEERLGGAEPGAEVWTKDSEAPTGGENQVIRPRIKELSGYFGNLVSRFCLRPDQSELRVRVQGESSVQEEGVSRETIDPSGQYRLSAAGMIAIERTGRIPVPVRTCYPTDNGHDLGNGQNPEVLKPFEHEESDPAYRQLELFDRQAYDLKNQYSRVDGMGTDEHDYDVPQEEEMAPIRDSYDERFFGNSTVELEKYDKRRAGVYIGEDGSVILRDAWGSEVVMLGGNITLSCAGNVMLLPGKTALTVAGDDIVQKAQNSVDIHASEHDVRLSAARNMEILGGGDEKSYSGGVVIESRGASFKGWDGTGDSKGEGEVISGITLRTKSQGVVIDGQRVNIRSRKDTRILSGDKKLNGKISMGAGSITARAKSAVVATKNAAVSVSGSGITEAAKSISICASDSLTTLSGGKYPVPAEWADTENRGEKLIPQFDEYTRYLEDEKEASDGFDAETLDKMVFNFRTSDQCGTDKSWVIGASGEFKMYEPAWAQIVKVYETLKGAGVQDTPYKEDAKWDNGAPWPGKDAESTAEYAELPESGPVNLTSDGFNANRGEVKPKSQISVVPLKGNYKVRK